MPKYHKNSEGYLKLIRRDYKNYNHFYDVVFFRSKNKEYFVNHTDASNDLVFATDSNFSHGFGFIQMLLFYDILYHKPGDNRIYFSKDIYLVETLDHFLFIIKNNLTLKEYSRIKKIRKLTNNEIEY